MNSFRPPHRVLMGPGPSEVRPSVLAALAKPTIGHLDPEFQTFMEELKLGLQMLFKAPGHACIPLPAPGSAGMEAALLNLLEPGDRAVVAINGAFGLRMAEIAERAGAEVIRIEHPWGEPVDLQRIEDALRKGSARLLAFVHAETSTGVCSDAAALCRLAEQHGAMSVVDCVTSLGGVEVDVDSWNADFVYSGTQKCLSAPPGLSPVAVSGRALAFIRQRSSKPRTWLYDLNLLMGYWGGSNARSYHHTAPINALYGLHEALVEHFAEGTTAVIDRHRSAHEGLVAGLKTMNLHLLPAEADRLPQLNAVLTPTGIDEAALRKQLLQDWNLEIGGGLGPLSGKVWRIGLMGTSATPWHVRYCLSALADGLTKQGRTVNAAAALDAAAQVSASARAPS